MLQMTVRAVPLTKDYYAIVDEADYERVMQHNWSINIQKRKKDGSIQYTHARSKIGGRQTKMHRFILRLGDPEIQVDHINGNPLDNRRANLQLATNQQNQANTRKRPGLSSKFKGVIWDKQYQKWRARIIVCCRNIHLGRFDSERDAAVAYNLRAYIEWGDRALLNDIPPLVAL